MRPLHLKSPFKWQDRHIVIHDRVWYVPHKNNQYEIFNFPGWNQPEVFAKDQPIKIEYCSGNGAWIAAKAKQYPQYNWVAVEMQFDRVRRIWSKLKNENLNNLLIVCGEALAVTQRYFPNQSASEVFVNFPDPWPKNRHAKHRLIQFPFIQEIFQLLLPGGVLNLVTDDENYSSLMISVMRKHEGFESLLAPPFFTTEWNEYGTSDFENLWRGMGKAIRYHQFKRK